MKAIVYHEGPKSLELPDGLGLIERGQPKDVPDELAESLVKRGDFVFHVEKPKPAKSAEPAKLAEKKRGE